MLSAFKNKERQETREKILSSQFLTVALSNGYMVSSTEQYLGKSLICICKHLNDEAVNPYSTPFIIQFDGKSVKIYSNRVQNYQSFRKLCSQDFSTLSELFRNAIDFDIQCVSAIKVTSCYRIANGF